MKGTIEYNAETNEFIIEVTKYDSKLISRIKRCDGAKYDTDKKTWTVPAQPYITTVAKNELEAKDEVSDRAVDAIYFGVNNERWQEFLKSLEVVETVEAVEIVEQTEIKTTFVKTETIKTRTINDFKVELVGGNFAEILATGGLAVINGTYNVGYRLFDNGDKVAEMYGFGNEEHCWKEAKEVANSFN